MFQGKIEIENGIITDIVKEKGNLRLIFDGKPLDLGNSFAYPGFVDSHLHLLGGGELLFMPDLSKARSAKECVDILRNSNYRRGYWIFARGWNQEFWDNKSFPDKSILDIHFPNTPVCLIRQDGHCLWLNSSALKICNINENTSEPNGGKIVKDANGYPTGILIDEAIELVRPFLNDYSENFYFKFLEKGIEHLASMGITTVHDMDVDPKYTQIYEKYFNQAETKINVRIFLSGKTVIDNGKIPEIQNKYLQIVGLKFYMDGALGSYGALLWEKYSDSPFSNGLQLMTKEYLIQSFHFAAKNNLGIAIHSIGDKSTTIILDTYNSYLNQGFHKPKFFRIEHCQIVKPSDLPRFKKLGIIASVQPWHFISDYQMAISRLGTRTKFSYPWKSFLNYGAFICSGSDFPVESPNPIYGLSALVNRTNFDFQNLFGVESIPIEYAIKTYTTFPRITLEEEDIKLKKGAEATLTILNKNLLEIPHEEIIETKVIATITKGQIIYIDM